MSLIAVDDDGVAVVEGDHLVFTPAADRWGAVTFGYTVSDGTNVRAPESEPSVATSNAVMPAVESDT